MIQSITILPGRNKTGNPETFDRIDICPGEIVGVVGPTGSGKSAFIEDIEQLAQADTPTGRRILINGRVPDQVLRFDPKRKLIAQLSQNMNFLADMTVSEFLMLHAKCRGKGRDLVDQVIYHANTLTGEPINKEMNLTVLSGGQSRSLMVADVAFISDSPVVLIDEIENAGIKKHKAMELLSGNGKVILIVTHDPLLALLTGRRIVMKNGGVEKIFSTTQHETDLCAELNKIDRELFRIRECVRLGEEIVA
ncbi:MAG: ATP-binding cassette domain-containing protein [Bacteroidales bacterium]|jgi:ABC-type lipoprotein export system ATPase subunit|nr:ATP-binding cassette domain-containing protein [Bacteroidales bacterium]MDD2263391.1 ATP-binding cassette domain-containing protein [Bacteroidales bacterium]MDD2830819.1 ATP-binding cassette domain-containing protein [Bacteroidales bacterium]MDD3208018.1 ATP-binding cassette domain-containing protein [Bacteroidales bacterium]MDD3696475.1 ATP-binding cassette domain-containing protein [Bacteroidales bacterium]